MPLFNPFICHPLGLVNVGVKVALPPVSPLDAEADSQ
tara:strand:+ start:620 stop:730 length:111 start_codon:yes stop_codon:yes gene_type:complete